MAQLGARFHGMEEVVGSIPTRSTNQFNNLVNLKPDRTRSSNPSFNPRHSSIRRDHPDYIKKFLVRGHLSRVNAMRVDRGGRRLRMTKRALGIKRGPLGVSLTARSAAGIPGPPRLRVGFLSMMFYGRAQYSLHPTFCLSWIVGIIRVQHGDHGDGTTGVALGPGMVSRPTACYPSKASNRWDSS